MIVPLLALFLFVQGPTSPPPLAVRDFPRSQVQPKVSGPISIELKQTTREAYETLAELGGLNLIFDPDFRNNPFASVRLENVDILQALDRVSLLTGNFVEVLDSKTLLVAPNNATKRRELETQVVKTIFLTGAKSPQDLTGIVTALRTTLQMRYIAQSQGTNAVIIKDSPDRIAAAEKLIAELDKPSSAPPIAMDVTGSLLSSDGRDVRKSAPARLRIQARGAGPISIDSNEDGRTTFEALAAKAGLNVIFDRDFRSPSPVPLKFDNVDAFDALDFLSLQTKTFWEFLDASTILVSPDNQVKRRDYSHLVVRTIYLDSNTTSVQATELVTALRTLLNLRYLAWVSRTNAIVMLDSPYRLAAAEKIIADLARFRAGLSLDAGSETGGVLRSRAVRNLALGPSQLRISIDIIENARQAFERVAGMGGLRVTFDGRFQDGAVQRFTFKDVAIRDALDFISLQTASFWEVLDSTTIIAAPDNQTVRRELEPRTQKVIGLTNAKTDGDVAEIVTALRILLNIRQIEGNGNAIVMNDTSDNVALAEKIVADLDRAGR